MAFRPPPRDPAVLVRIADVDFFGKVWRADGLPAFHNAFPQSFDALSGIQAQVQALAVGCAGWPFLCPLARSGASQYYSQPPSQREPKVQRDGETGEMVRSPSPRFRIRVPTAASPARLIDWMSFSASANGRLTLSL